MDEEAEILKRRLLFSVVQRGACYWVVELWPDDFHRPLALFDTELASGRGRPPMAENAGAVSGGVVARASRRQNAGAIVRGRKLPRWFY